MKTLGTLTQKRVVVPAGCLFFLFALYFSFVSHHEPTEIGVARNWVSGEMWLQEGGGFFVAWPWVWVARIDTRPVRVSVQSAGRAYNAKLVQFNRDKWREFVDQEGWRYYWLANRVSFNGGHKEEHRGMKDILRGYAYSRARYSFITVLAEFESE